jgi:hypothetical protein
MLEGRAPGGAASSFMMAVRWLQLRLVYVCIAVMSRPGPMMFMTRVRL